ncbi:rod shape-determining protein MreD [Gilvimarinus agarilyticus]|uniref:rod shape-determining protein MreD n=1 Tax=unclassified Gilvimarinus TaxID=2642066 RepID=UPI001C0997E9|nr:MULTISPECIES: rod shape-determining protein MreD [unclassified Gilvimarinus]MBU2885432.1 rod shape-determining protein MreD [Gilvimarinus agarilyticus]MDO6570332.1 rod shape-determining protein MreD [Gilvimarinus sp. 2_MG-2023]MDO6746881.1 rod shape-determining protein MreD [Gilvimarinus sp. 1_MG-2023]
MVRERFPTYLLLFSSLLLAFLLDIYPLALEYRVLRPQFVLLVAIYWVFVLPQSASMTLLFLLGLMQDIVVGVPLGQHALIFVVVAYLCLRSCRRVRHFARWQEALWILCLVALGQAISGWVQSLAGREITGWQFLLPALASASVWPLLSLVMDVLRRYYRIARQI